MLKQLRKKTEGFTIIEVMIVLAIAGLILLIVFLAVPALQRNSRNTAMRNDAASVLGIVNEYVSANNGTLPDTCAIDIDTGVLTISGAGSPITGKVRPGMTCSMSDGEAMAPDTNYIAINKNHKCLDNDFDTTATSRAVSAGFLVETGGGATAKQCVES